MVTKTVNFKAKLVLSRLQSVRHRTRNLDLNGFLRLFVTYCKYMDIMISTAYTLYRGLLSVSWLPVPI